MSDFTSRKKYKFLSPLLSGSLAVIFLFFQAHKVFSQNNSSTSRVPAQVESGANFLQLASPVHHVKEENQAQLAKSAQQRNSNSSSMLMAVPGNDNCSAALAPAYSLSSGANCKSGSFQGSGGGPGSLATTEAGETFGCNNPMATGVPTKSVWYSFIASQANMWLSLKQTSTPFVCSYNFGIRVYTNTGTCPPPSGSAVGCKSYTMYSAQQIYNILNMTGLVPGTTYLVQVLQDPACSDYDFCIALGVPSACTTCANICGPMCVFSGPLPPTTIQVTSTCPSYPLAPPMNEFDTRTNCYSFTATNDSVWLQQIVYAYCNPNTYSFTYTLYNNACSQIGPGNVNVFTNNLITGLTVGTTYRICYTLQSACTWDSVVWPYAYTTSNALPVELLSLGAIPCKDKVKIYWATASEQNAREFIIEKTSNARDFTEVAHVKASGNSTSLVNYKGYDDHPFNGENYYRLKQIDFNGEAFYTKLVSAKFLTSIADLTIIPNPAKDIAVVRFNATGNYPANLTISNILGKTVKSMQITAQEGLNLYSLGMNELSKGIYSVRVLVDDQNMISKLVKE